jgi:ubiquinone/menaquinone biosynthesis C-methylase UbiE
MRSTLLTRISRRTRRLRPVRRGEQAISTFRPGDYESRYEAHARSSDIYGVGGGDYDKMGETQLDILRSAGLRPGHTLVDFGCGNGRLAVHAVQYLQGGSYVGIDISKSFLVAARHRIDAVGSATCDVRLLHQTTEAFDVEDGAADFICAYSVFTHMEPEDLYRYLVALRRIIKNGGQALLSFLPLDLQDARDVFLNECQFDPVQRWDRVRNFTTSQELVNSIAAMADWSIVKWLSGAQAQAVDVNGDDCRLGQSVVVLTPG